MTTTDNITFDGAAGSRETTEGTVFTVTGHSYHTFSCTQVLTSFSHSSTTCLRVTHGTNSSCCS